LVSRRDAKRKTVRKNSEKKAGPKLLVLKTNKTIKKWKAARGKGHEFRIKGG